MLGFADCRLGHREQKDEWAPRRVDVFTRQNVLPPNAVVSAGSLNSACTAGMVLPPNLFSHVIRTSRTKNNPTLNEKKKKKQGQQAVTTASPC